jgi:hypothetical protein
MVNDDPGFPAEGGLCHHCVITKSGFASRWGCQSEAKKVRSLRFLASLSLSFLHGTPNLKQYNPA